MSTFGQWNRSEVWMKQHHIYLAIIQEIIKVSEVCKKKCDASIPGRKSIFVKGLTEVTAFFWPLKSNGDTHEMAPRDFQQALWRQHSRSIPLPVLQVWGRFAWRAGVLWQSLKFPSWRAYLVTKIILHFSETLIFHLR